MGSGSEGRLVRLRTWLLDRPRYHKRALLTIVDLLLLSLVLWIALSVRYGELFVPASWLSAVLMISGPLITVGTLWHLGIYRLVTRFIGRRGIAQVLIGMALAVLIWSLLVFMVGQFGVPRTVITAYGVIGAAVLLAVRWLIKLLLDSAGIRFRSSDDSGIRKATMIYGADAVGVALLQAAQKARDRYIVGFVDPSPTLWRQYVGGLKVYPPQRLARLIEREQVQEILVAIQSNHRRERKRILQELEQLPVAVKVLPTYEDVSAGNVSLMSLRDVEVGDLLGRDPVAPNVTLMNGSIVGKSVLVTGAAGSIGSELVRQIARRSPRRLVLLDNSERGLYEIECEMRALLERDPEVVRPELKVVLGSVTDAALLDQVISENAIETIYHAAAYKHVPLVELNPLAGIENNVFGTFVAAQAARRHGVERFVLISTDKAVRPTNVMGASKRLAELILQAEARDEGNTTVFTMVRFGNVLDSSGSVVPLFRNQIRAGGPITVTHPDVTRYFMSIPEAAELVIQAGAMAAGGEVFILHMGDPVKIDDLARLMVRLSNLEVRDAANPFGDIEIVYTGLRPGEKLYEELLIGANAQTTEHSRIFKSDEPFLAPAILLPALEELREDIAARDQARVMALIRRTVEDYSPVSEETQGKTTAGDGWPGQISQTVH
jgi:FlaA1/EpsC-like NDP-sugar epimerase